jgi:hypothetical protein
VCAGTATCAGHGDGGAAGATGDISGAAGDVARGVSSGLGSFDATLLTFGVLGPAGARGTCTVIPLVPFVSVFVGSGSGTGVFATGEGATDAGASRGVETADAGVGIGEDTAFGAGATGCSRSRLGSGGLVALSWVATEASLVTSAALSVAGGGDASRFRLLEGRGAAFFFWVAGVATL